MIFDAPKVQNCFLKYFFYICKPDGPLAQLARALHGMHEVVGSDSDMVHIILK